MKEQSHNPWRGNPNLCICFVAINMASSGSYHLKTNCTNVDVTSNLKQRRHGEAIRMQSKGLIANRSAYSSGFSAWIECFKNIDVGPCDLHVGPGQAHVSCLFDRYLAFSV